MVPPVGLIKAGEAPAFQESVPAAKGDPAQALIGQEPLELALGLKGYPFNDRQRDFLTMAASYTLGATADN